MAKQPKPKQKDKNKGATVGEVMVPGMGGKGMIDRLTGVVRDINNATKPKPKK